MFQRLGAVAYKANLDNTHRLDAYFNHPHKKFQSIHVAGTNGKGSVSHMLASILQEAGYTTGLYTSPHLLDFRERIKVNGEMISEQSVVDFVNIHTQLISEIKPSFFEMTVAMAFDYFAHKKVDIAVVEVGLGGRLDSTNIITPNLSVITNIGLDHKTILGYSLKDIAKEKAGIIKLHVPVVIGRKQAETEAVFADVAQKKSADIYYADAQFRVAMNEVGGKVRKVDVWQNDELYLQNLNFPLLGIYQEENLRTVLTSVNNLIHQGFNISKEQIKLGLEKVIDNTLLRGRWQQLGQNPSIICDTGHNIDGVRQVVEQINKEPFEQLHMVIGMAEDKDVDEILSILPTDAIYYFTRADSPRSFDPNELKKRGASFNLHGNSYNSVDKAVLSAKKNAAPNDLIFIGGSTFVVAEVI